MLFTSLIHCNGYGVAMTPRACPDLPSIPTTAETRAVTWLSTWARETPVVRFRNGCQNKVRFRLRDSNVWRTRRMQVNRIWIRVRSGYGQGHSNGSSIVMVMVKASHRPSLGSRHEPSSWYFYAASPGDDSPYTRLRCRRWYLFIWKIIKMD